MTSKTTAILALGFTLAALLITADEIFDIPALVFNAPPTPINWTEISIELSCLVIVGVVIIFSVYRLGLRRKRAEEQLRKLEEKYSTLVEQSSDGIIIIQDGLLKFANMKMLKMSGFSLDETTGSPFLNFVSPEYKVLVMERYQRRVSGEEVPNNYEIEIIAKDGRHIPVEINANRIEYEGKLADMAIVRDITERKLSEERIKHLSSVLQALRNVNQLITRESNREHLIQQSCDILVRDRGYERAWILLVDEKGNPLSVAAAGLGDESLLFLEQMRQGKYPYCVRELWAQENRLLTYNCPGQRQKKCTLADVHKDRGVYRCRLEYEGKTYGVLGVTLPSTVVANKEEQNLFRELAGDISFALAAIERQEERKRAEEQTRQLEEYLQLQVDRMPIGLIVWDTDFCAKSWNPAAEKIFGFTAEEAQGKHPYDLIVPKEAQSHVDNIWRRLLEGDTTAHSINENTTKDGRTIICRWSNTPLKEANGTVVGVLSMVEDITGRKKAEEEVERSRKVLQTIIDSMPFGIVIIDKEKNIRHVNNAALALIGYESEEQVVGMVCNKTLCPAEAGKCPILDLGKELDKSERILVTKDKRHIPILKSVVPIKLDGEDVLLEGFIDITERKRAEEELRASEEKLRLMFESLAEGITVSDLNANIVQVNEAAVRMHGYETDKDIVGRSSLELIAEKDRTRALENLGKTLAGGHVKDIEYTFLTREGREFPAELSAAILRDASGKPIGFIGITEDITERKKMEEQLILTDRLASIGELASGIAHELNNPLTGVIGLSQLLVERDLPEDAKEDLKLVYSEAQRAADVVKNLLTFARKHSPAKQLLNLNDVIGKVLELRAYEQRVSNIEVVKCLAPDLPQIMADYFQLQQVFLNIIINTEYFMLEAHNKGTLTITTERAGDIVRASFADDGPGMPKENLLHIFDPFFTTKEVGKGTGLGLSICHGIVTAHGGRIYAESEPGKGATFIVELPIKQEEQ
jgi:PAS domain S-box-containing protein